MYLGNIVETSDTIELFKNPKHPYTKALLEALPNKRETKLKTIKGMVSPITQPVSGCKFHPRCEFEKEECKFKEPEFINGVACYLYN